MGEVQKRLQVLGIDRVEAKTDLSRTTIYRKIKEGEFPPGFKISRKRRVWEETDIDNWISDLMQRAV